MTDQLQLEALATVALASGEGASAVEPTGLDLTVGGPRLPLRAVVSKQAILGMSGSGKTQTARKLAEAMMDAQQHVVIFDPTGAWWGLRSSADGERAGYPIVVFGGDHADAPLRADAGAVLARAVMERRFNAIFDLSNFHEAEMRRCQTDFLNTLNRLNKQPIHVIFDEFDITCPQAKSAGSEESRAAVNTTVRRGRIRGIGSTMVTQNPQDADKSALNMADTVIVMRTAGSQSIDAIENWVKRNGSKEQMQQMTATLPSLPTGSGWIWSPQIALFELVRFQLCWTFDSSKTPELGETVVAPRVLAPIDLQALGREITKQVQEEHDASVPHLRERIKALEAEGRGLERALQAAQAAGPKAEEEGERVMGLMEDVARIEREAEEAKAERDAAQAELEELQGQCEVSRAFSSRLQECIEEVRAVLARLPDLDELQLRAQAVVPAAAPVPPAQRRAPAAAQTEPDDPAAGARLNAPQQKILNALATGAATVIPWDDDWTACLADTTARARGFEENVRLLRNLELVTRDGGRLALTPEGAKLAVPLAPMRRWDSVMTLLALRANGKQLQILKLIREGCEGAEVLAAAMETTVRSRGYEENVRKLVSLGCVLKRGASLELAPWLKGLR